MSGTSADGVDVAICRIGAGADGEPRIKVLGHASFPYPEKLREAVLGTMDAGSMSVAAISQLNWRLGAVYADAVVGTCQALGVAIGGMGDEARAVPLGVGHSGLGKGSELGLVGCHGQTVYHQAMASPYLGKQVRSTWQIGEAALIAERLRVPVVSDFRPADMAAGGQGAPLVPMLDWVMFRSTRVGRVLQNLGGIGNMTAIPVRASVDKVLAFDTGPGNMVIDHCMQRLFGRKFDRGGSVGRQGRVLQKVVERAMEARYFASAPPKTCGREEFGEKFGDELIARCRAAGGTDADVVATATALTAAAVVRGYRSFVLERMEGSGVEYAVAGGGAKNATLMRMLREGLEPMGVTMRSMEEMGIAVEAKEAVAFALLAWLTWERRPGNVMSATGAEHPVVLGKVSFC